MLFWFYSLPDAIFLPSASKKSPRMLKIIESDPPMPTPVIVKRSISKLLAK